MAIETPNYQLVKKSNRFELREYDPYLEAQITVTASDHRTAASKGFGDLADFIFGNNTANHKIGMTSPVSAQLPTSRLLTWASMRAQVGLPIWSSTMVNSSFPSAQDINLVTKL